MDRINTLHPLLVRLLHFRSGFFHSPISLPTKLHSKWDTAQNNSLGYSRDSTLFTGDKKEAEKGKFFTHKFGEESFML